MHYTQARTEALYHVIYFLLLLLILTLAGEVGRCRDELWRNGSDVHIGDFRETTNIYPLYV